jgi:hypothetical protein
MLPNVELCPETLDEARELQPEPVPIDSWPATAVAVLACEASPLKAAGEDTGAQDWRCSISMRWTGREALELAAKAT